MKTINWNKKLIVFFGEEAKKHRVSIEDRCVGKSAFVAFPECECFHPWEHVEVIEHITHLISRSEDRKFVVVTNSSYIIDHLSNLMKGARIGADKKYTKSGNAGCYINKKDVGAYVCAEGKIENAMPRAGEIIKWDSLSQVADWLCDTYFEMGDKP